MIALLLIQLIGFILPWPLRRRLLCLAGFGIDRSARIGYSLFLVRNVRVGARSRVGHGNLVRKLRWLHIGQDVQVGNFNQIVGADGIDRHYEHLPDRQSTLTIGDHVGITHSHLIDCTDRVSIGAFTTIAGWGTQIVTHGIDVVRNRQEAAPVEIGRHVFVGTRCLLLKATSVPDRCVLAAGAVVAAPLTQELAIYGGVPARKVGEIDASAGYFKRDVGYVD